MDLIHPFFVKYEPTYIEAFDTETRDIDGELATRDSSQDIALDKQTANLVDISVVEECDRHHSNLDDPIVED